jgi:hypothetical protein
MVIPVSKSLEITYLALCDWNMIRMHTVRRCWYDSYQLGALIRRNKKPKWLYVKLNYILQCKIWGSQQRWL